MWINLICSFMKLLTKKYFLIWSILLGIGVFFLSSMVFDIFMRDCSHLVTTQVHGNSMHPILQDGENISVRESYYTCHAIQREDIVIYQSLSRWQLVKQVKALPGDEVTIDTETQNLRVNHLLLKNPRGEPYIFTSGELKFLSLFLEDGYLKSPYYFLFGTLPSGSFDSRKIGWVLAKDILGKVILP